MRENLQAEDLHNQGHEQDAFSDGQPSLLMAKGDGGTQSEEMASHLSAMAAVPPSISMQAALIVVLPRRQHHTMSLLTMSLSLNRPFKM